MKRATPMRTIVFDLSLSRRYFGSPAVGIVRVEREIGKFLLTQPDTRFVYFDDSFHRFRQVGRRLAETILHNRGRAPDAGEFDPSERARFDIGREHVVLNCGLTWDTPYLQDIYRIKKASGCKFVQVIYDIIPTIMPETCPDGMLTAFPRFVLDVAWTADAVFCDSDSTASDLDRYLETNGAPKPFIGRLHLGSERFGPAGAADDGTDRTRHKASVAPSRLRGERFVMFVSSIEPRKNHHLLFHVWKRLRVEHGDDIPTLVFIGRPAWNVSDFMNAVRRSEIYREGKIKILDSLTDTDLDWLYRNCLFTVYPSLYEGWGLPVSESICYGKFFIAADTSSIPEASQGLGLLLPPHDFEAWYGACEHYGMSDDARAMQETDIVARRSLTTWRQGAQRFQEELSRYLSDGDAR